MNCKNRVFSRSDEVKDTIDFSLLTEPVFLISWLSLCHFLAQCGGKDVLNDLVLVEKVFIFF